MSIKTIISIYFLLFITAFPVYAFDYVTGKDRYEEPNIAKPDKGEAIIDANFNTTIRRITDKTNDGYGGSEIRPLYVNVNSSNCDNSLLVLKSSSNEYWLYHGSNSDTPYKLIRELTFIESCESSPHWDKDDPDLLYYTRSKYQQIRTDGPKLYSYKPSTDTSTLLHDFTHDEGLSQFFTGDNEIPNGTTGGHYIHTEEYNEPSWDCRYWAFWIKHRTPTEIKAAFTYDLKENRILGVLYAGEDPVSSYYKGVCSVSPLGTYIGIRDNSGKVLFWDKTLSTYVEGITGVGHRDWALDVSGVECIFFSDDQRDNWAIFYPSTGYKYGLIARADDGEYADSHPCGHSYMKPGWGLVSTYVDEEPGKPWFEEQIFMIELDPNKAFWKSLYNGSRIDLSPQKNPTVWRLAHTHSDYAEYNDQPRASISHNGKYIYWQSNWDNASGNMEVYELELPATWPQGDVTGTTPPPPPTTNHSVLTSYNFEDTDASILASKYDVIITDLGEASAISEIKKINPVVKSLHYDNALTHGGSEGYLVLDTVTGKKIVHDDWGWYLHDISNPDYRADLANYIVSNLENYTQFDGVLLDDCWGNAKVSEFHQEGTSDDPTLPPDLVDNWQSYMISLIQEIKSAIEDKLLIINTGWYATYYLAYCDGQTDEGFAHANWQEPDEFLGIESWKNHIAALKNAVANSKYYIAGSGVSDGATQEQIDSIALYSFCSFLMGVPVHNTLAKHGFRPSLYYEDYYWYSFWEVNLGEPEGSYYQISDTDFFRRDFTNGIVLVNPTDQNGNIILEEDYYDLSGNTVSEVYFSSHEGTILLNKASTPSTPANPAGLKIIYP